MLLSLNHLSVESGLVQSGLLFGIPLLSLITMAIQANRLKKGWQTSYDAPASYQVRIKPIEWPRKLIFGITFLGLFIAIVALNYSY